MICKKAGFDTRAQARERLAEIRQDDTSSHEKPIREYFCEMCGKWHLTSKTVESYQKRRKKNNQKRKGNERERMTDKEIKRWENKLGIKIK